MIKLPTKLSFGSGEKISIKRSDVGLPMCMKRRGSWRSSKGLIIFTSGTGLRILPEFKRVISLQTALKKENISNMF